ncbi:MAG: hypothetical protein AB1349_11780 [Elusimicrobiota bacterium]
MWCLILLFLFTQTCVSEEIEPVVTLYSPEHSVAKFSSDMKYLAIGTFDGKVEIYSCKDWRKVTELITRYSVSSIDFSSDGRFVVASCADKVDIWDMVSFEKIIRLERENSAWQYIEFSPKCDKVSAFGLRFETEKKYTLEQKADLANVLAWTFGGAYITARTGGAIRYSGVPVDSSVRVEEITKSKGTMATWNTKTWYLIDSAEDESISHTNILRREGKILVQQDRIYDQVEQKTVFELDKNLAVRYLTFCLNTKLKAYFIEGKEEKPRIITKTPAKFELGRIEKKSLFPVKILKFSPNGRILCSDDKNNRLHLWDTFSQKEIIPLKLHRNQIVLLEFSPDDNYLLSGDGQNIYVWNIAEIENLFGGRK